MAGNLNLEVLKVPIGFIRVIEIPLAIITFATTTGYNSGCFSYSFVCPQPPPTLPRNDTISRCWYYPFTGLSELRIPINACEKDSTSATTPSPLFVQNDPGSAQFFVFVGVIAFLYAAAILAFYLYKWPTYEAEAKFPQLDFIITAIQAAFWFIAACAWSDGVRKLKNTTDYNLIKPTVDASCTQGNTTSCTFPDTWNYASLNVSLILGFACVFVWVGNAWFVYKETIWFKNRQAGGGAAKTQQGFPPAQPVAGGVYGQPTTQTY